MAPEAGQPVPSVLLDTDVCSYILNGHTRGDSFKALLVGKAAAVSFMTIGQMYLGAYQRGWGDRRMTRLGDYLATYAVLPYSADVALAWARIRAQRQAAGMPNEESDMWIAACALVFDCPLATNNTAHFSGMPGLRLLTASQ